LRDVDRDQLVDVLHLRQAEIEHRVAVPRVNCPSASHCTRSARTNASQLMAMAESR
jgi:hypothetical protein